MNKRLSKVVIIVGICAVKLQFVYSFRKVTYCPLCATMNPNVCTPVVLLCAAFVASATRIDGAATWFWDSSASASCSSFDAVDRTNIFHRLVGGACKCPRGSILQDVGGHSKSCPDVRSRKFNAKNNDPTACSCRADCSLYGADHVKTKANECACRGSHVIAPTTKKADDKCPS